MKLLYVHGDGDYNAMMFEQNLGVEKAKEMIKEGKKIEDDEFIVDVLEFGDVDKKFIEFIIDHFLDYDSSKCSNFYIIE